MGLLVCFNKRKYLYGLLNSKNNIIVKLMIKLIFIRSLHDMRETLTRVYLLDFFCSDIQFYLLLSPYPCFISLLYLDLYVLGDDALIS